MKNVVFGEYFARFEGIWQTKCIKDEEVDKLSVEDRAKDGEEIPMRAIMMMKRKTNDDEEVWHAAQSYQIFYSRTSESIFL